MIKKYAKIEKNLHISLWSQDVLLGIKKTQKIGFAGMSI